MKIDLATGKVALTSDFHFGPTTPLAVFQAHEDCIDWNESNRSCSILALEVEKRPLKLRIYFNEGLIQRCLLEINLHDHDPPFTRDEFSYELQARELEIYKHILHDQFGRPDEIRKTLVGSNEFPSLNRYCIWNMKWGHAYAGAHPKDEMVSASFIYNKNQRGAKQKRLPPFLRNLVCRFWPAAN